MPIKVLVADDSDVMRPAIVRMLESDPDLKVIGEARTLSETVELVSVTNPDIVVLDLHMPDERLYAPEVVKLSVLEKAGCILAISIWNDDDAIALAQSLGAKALLDKTNLFSELIPAIKKYCSPDPSDAPRERQ
jgi:DNA-binding NarL/FixJ family response regulator